MTHTTSFSLPFQQLELHSAESVSESDSLEDPELLMQVMEFRERLEECETEEEAQGIRDENEGESVFLSLNRMSWHTF